MDMKRKLFILLTLMMVMSFSWAQNWVGTWAKKPPKSSGNKEKSYQS